MARSHLSRSRRARTMASSPCGRASEKFSRPTIPLLGVFGPEGGQSRSGADWTDDVWCGTGALRRSVGVASGPPARQAPIASKRADSWLRQEPARVLRGGPRSRSGVGAERLRLRRPHLLSPERGVRPARVEGEPPA
eukprot:6175502-Pleurochrysis_carterae.AAC.1